MLKLATFGLLCAVALVVAACSRSHEERRLAVLCAAVIGANWLLFAMPWIYNPLSLAHIAKVSGIPVSHEDMWSLIDLLSLVIVAWAGRSVWWSAMVWSVYLVALTMHALAWANGLQYDQYDTVLDFCLVVQIAVIFMVGGDGCADYLSRGCGKLRDLVGATRTGASTFAREESPE